MEIFSIPEEVFYGSILPKLDWNDLLRFRRVSKLSKLISDGYIKNHPEAAPEIEINETDKTMGKFLELGISTTKIFLNNISGAQFYDKQHTGISTFLTDLGPLITNLRVHQLSICLQGKEWDFFDALPNLQQFEAGDFGLGPNIAADMVPQLESHHEDEVIARGMLYPNIFKSLKRLKLGVYDASRINDMATKALQINMFCENLEYVCLPFGSSSQVSTDEMYNFIVLGMTMGIMEAFVIKGRYFDSPDKLKLKVFDFEYYYLEDQTRVFARMEEREASRSFLSLCATCVEVGVKLQSVKAAWFQDAVLHNANPGIGSCVSSLFNLHPSLAHVDLPNMSGLTIWTSRSGLVPGDPNWPSLKSLGIIIDSNELDRCGSTAVSAPRTRLLFDYLFLQVSHLQLVELLLEFKLEGEGSIPKAEQIVSACPNLKKVTFINWPGKNKALLTLWRGLPGLEEITLDSCKMLGNVAFVGENVRDPVFFKLPALRKLTLKGMDQMPKITDLLFTMVLQHLSLTDFTMTSAAPIKNITAAGIRALLGGKFANSIETFPFKGWALADSSDEELMSLGSEFRSYNMI